jgi:hypothetical protein
MKKNNVTHNNHIIIVVVCCAPARPDKNKKTTTKNKLSTGDERLPSDPSKWEPPEHLRFEGKFRREWVLLPRP